MTTTDLRHVDRYEDNGDEELDDRDDGRVVTPAEREVTGELVQGELAGRPIYIPPVKKWRASALHALREGDFETWAEVTFSEDDYDLWVEIDPTMEEIEAFFKTVNPGLGTNSGNSRASRRSARNTRKR